MHGIQVAIALILFAVAFQALPKDVSQEQSAVEYARQEYENSVAEHKADADQVATTAKALESLKKRLDQERKEASLSEKKKQHAKARLDRAQKALDQAWRQ
jgi:septal ring factor EnvC (AmiA/AmiB activator)